MERGFLPVSKANMERRGREWYDFLIITGDAYVDHPAFGSAQDPHEKAMQRALMQWRRPEKRPPVLEALRLAHREDLIGYGKHCLTRPTAPGPPDGRGQRRVPGQIEKQAKNE